MFLRSPKNASLQKVHNFLKWRLANETPKVSLKSRLGLRVGGRKDAAGWDVFFSGWRSLEEEG